MKFKGKELTREEEVERRWREYFRQLLNEKAKHGKKMRDWF